MISPDRRIALAAFAYHGKQPWLDKAAVFCARETIIVMYVAEMLLLVRLLHILDGYPAHYWLNEIARAVRLPSLVGLVAWGLAVLLDVTFRRPRPFLALNKKMLDHFWVPLPSMPSSHAAIAFALTVPMFALSVPLGIAYAVAAASVAAARVYAGVHYLSDVIVGGALGILVSALVLRFLPL